MKTRLHLLLLAVALTTLSACSDIDRNARHQPQVPEQTSQSTAQ